MKDITFAVPCYNSQAYMRKCIESLLAVPENSDRERLLQGTADAASKDEAAQKTASELARIEIIIVDDGSSDDTGRIADEYEAKYPGVIRAIHQENRGHGGAINHALELAAGRFFKVVDSDDWVGQKAYKKVLDTIAAFNADNHYPDMLIFNYVYDKVDIKRKRRMRYLNCFPVESFFTWEDVGHTNLHQYLLMHAVMYRTDILRKSGLVMPEHMFYVDNIFVFIPMKYVNEMYYIDEDFYRYFIGRSDQSVNEKVMIGRIDQQIAVTKMLVDNYSFEGPKNRVLYMRKYIRIMMEVSSVLCVISYDKELIAKKNELWRYVKAVNPRLYRLLISHFMGWNCFLPGKAGQKITRAGYRLSNRIYGFN